MFRRVASTPQPLQAPLARFFGRGPHRGGGVRRPPQTLKTPGAPAAATTSSPQSDGATPVPSPIPDSAAATTTTTVEATLSEAHSQADHGAEIKRLARMAYSSAFCREQIRERCKTAAVEIALKHFDDFATGMATYTNTAADRSTICGAGDDLAKLEALLASFERWYYERTAPRVVDLARPSEWYPRARMMRRKFIFHCGPTNSGKTHAALEALKAAKSGVYCAPLKALAAQVWRRVNSAGVPCDLLIGDERQFAGFADHTSCTVEMTPIEFQVDVGVIDEIQLIEDRDRGAAWTRALLGLPAREIHLCGEERALEVVKQILYESRELKGLEVRRYNRLVPLEIEKSSLDGDFSRLRNGDCLVTFSRKSVFSLAAAIRKAHPHASVRTIYGSLPFAVRERESDAFNDAVSSSESGDMSILVTTDAIAYGLNLSIRRVIFTATTKYDGRSMVKLSPTTVMQVAGRAGRFGMRFDRGFVAGLRRREHNDVVDVIGSTGNVSKLQPTTPIKRAGLLPTAEILGTFVSMRRRKALAAGATDPPFAELVAAFAAECRVGGVYFACDMERALLPIARLVSRVDMPDDDRIMFCFAPVGVANKDAAALVASWAEMHAKGEPVKLQLEVRLDELLNGGSDQVPDSLLMELESIYRLAEGYCWLAWRFRRSFVELELGAETKQRCADAIAKRLPN